MIPIATEISTIQGSESWMTLRAGVITCSRFFTVLHGREQSLQTYLDELRSPPEYKDLNVPSLVWGRKYEKQALAEYQLVTNIRMRKSGFWKHNTLRVGGSPDAISKDPHIKYDRVNITTVGDGEDEVLFCASQTGLFASHSGVEIKCPYNQEVHRDTLLNGCPEEHLPQIRGYMWLTDSWFWDFVSYDPRLKNPNHRIFIQRIERCLKEERKLKCRVQKFHDILVNQQHVHQPEKNPAGTLLSDKPIKLF